MYPAIVPLIAHLPMCALQLTWGITAVGAISEPILEERFASAATSPTSTGSSGRVSNAHRPAGEGRLMDDSGERTTGCEQSNHARLPFQVTSRRIAA
jgi:hypothetical protein